MKKMLNRYVNRARHLARNLRDLDKVLVNQGRILSRDYAQRKFNDISEAEFQIFSQWGEDGIIQYLVQNIDIAHRKFIEFGVETFTEANCRFLMLKDFWQGLVIDGSSKNIASIRQSDIHWRHPLRTVEAFISKDNIVDLVGNFASDGLGILSVDIDGVDYFVLEALGDLRPAIVVVEYNGLFGPHATVSVPYSSDFVRSRAHHSNIYYGASIAAFDHLLSHRDFALVGGNSAGNNAFFVRRDLLNDKIREVSVAQAFRETSFSEVRDAAGNLTFVRGLDRRALISDMPLVDVVTGESLRVADLPTT